VSAASARASRLNRRAVKRSSVRRGRLGMGNAQKPNACRITNENSHCSPVSKIAKLFSGCLSFGFLTLPDPGRQGCPHACSRPLDRPGKFSGKRSSSRLSGGSTAQAR
jgi:hypothetical protein